MLILVHLDAQISGARVLYDVYCCLLTELGVLLFLLHLMCASYEYELYRCFNLCHAIFTEVYFSIFVISLVTSTSMKTRLRDISVFRDLGILPSLLLLLFCC